MASNIVVRNMFVYGTLLAPEVVSALIHHAPASSPALIHDYHRPGVKDSIYAAVLPVKGDKVYGKGKTTMETTLEEQVPRGMSGQDAVSAGIENVAKVGTATSHDSWQAYIYVWASDVELIGDWDYEVWRRIHLEEYVKMCKEFASQLPQHTED